MKTLTARKVVAVFAAVSLAFLQVAPAGFAATTSSNQILGTSVSTPEKSATDPTPQKAPAPVVVPPTTTNFQMNTGGISATDTTVVKSTPVKPLPVPLPAKLLVYPPAVQGYVKDLQTQLGDGFKVSVLLQRDGTYQVTIRRIIDKPAIGSFTSATFTVDTQGVLQPKSVQVVYAGMAVDGRLLFESLMQFQNKCFDAICPAIRVLPDPKKALTLMSQISVSSVDSNGAIHFTLNSQYYKTYRDSTGQVILEKELPPAVREYVAALQKQLGTGFSVTAVVQPDGTYLVSIAFVSNPACSPGQVCAMIMKKPSAGTFLGMSFVIYADGRFAGVQTVNYAGIKNVDSKLLLAGMKLLQPGASDTDAMMLMTRITVTSVETTGTIHFTQDGQYYKTYRDATGNVKLEKELPPAVQAYVNDLQTQLGSGFTVTAIPQTDGTYQVTIHRIIDKPAIGSFGFVTFTVDPKGVFQSGSIQAVYAGMAVDGNLLFAGMKLLQPNANDADAIVLMTKITVTKVEDNGTIHFSQNGITWKVYWDTTTTDKKAIIEREITMPDGSVLSIRELSHSEMLQVVNDAGLSDADRDAAIAAINALPATAGFYRTTVVSPDGSKSVYYECSPVKRDLSVASPQSMYIPGNAMPDPGIVEAYAAGSTSPFFKSEMFFKPDGFFLSVVSIENAGTQPQAALVKTFKLDGTPYAEVYFDAQGNVAKTVYYQYDWNSLPKLESPANAVVFPSTMKHYGAQGNLLREFSMGASGEILSMTVYGNIPVTQIPATVNVYKADGSLFSTLSYDTQGHVTQVVYDFDVSQGFDALKAVVESAPAGSTVQITGEGTITGDKLVVPAGVTLNPGQAQLNINEMVFGTPPSVDPSGNLVVITPSSSGTLPVITNGGTITLPQPQNITLDASAGLGALNTAAGNAQPGTTITVTGEGTLAGDSLVIPQGVTVVLDPGARLNVGALAQGGPVAVTPVPVSAGTSMTITMSGQSGVLASQMTKISRIIQTPKHSRIEKKSKIEANSKQTKLEKSLLERERS